MQNLGSDDGHSGDDTINSNEVVDSLGVETSWCNVILAEVALEGEGVIGLFDHGITSCSLLVGSVVLEAVNDSVEGSIQDFEAWNGVLEEGGNELLVLGSQIIKIDCETALITIYHLLNAGDHLSGVEVLGEELSVVVEMLISKIHVEY